MRRTQSANTTAPTAPTNTQYVALVVSRTVTKAVIPSATRTRRALLDRRTLCANAMRPASKRRPPQAVVRPASPRSARTRPAMSRSQRLGLRRRERNRLRRIGGRWLPHRPGDGAGSQHGHDEGPDRPRSCRVRQRPEVIRQPALAIRSERTNDQPRSDGQRHTYGLGSEEHPLEDWLVSGRVPRRPASGHAVVRAILRPPESAHRKRNGHQLPQSPPSTRR